MSVGALHFSLHCRAFSHHNSYSGKEVCHGHFGCDPVASFAFAHFTEADVHARVRSGLIGVVVVGQDILLELAFIVVVSLRGRGR